MAFQAVRPMADRLRDAKAALVELARDYAGSPSPETWRELCRAKATIDALGGRA